MAYAHKSKNGAKRLSIKTPRTPVSAYRYAVTYKNIITVVIVVITIIVAVATICASLLSPERQIPRQIESLAASYYKNIFYSGMLNSDNYNGDPQSTLQKFEAPGISPVSLRQLLLLNDDVSSSDANYIKKYCDENETYVIFHPESPYAENSYRADITYSCNF